MKTRVFTSLCCGVLAALSAHAADAPGELSAPMIRLRSFVENPRADRLAWVHDEAAALAGNPASADAVRGLVRGIFLRGWIDSAGDSALSLAQFDSLAEAVGLFGADRAGLVELVARPGVPAAWLQTDFRTWLRGKLPASAGGRRTVERFLSAAAVPDAGALMQRFAFTLEVMPEADLATIDERYARDVWGQADPPRMAPLHRALGGVETAAGLTRLGERPARIRQQMGDRLFGMEVTAWPGAGDALPPLTRASKAGSRGFLKKAADLVKPKTEARNDAVGGAIRLLTPLVGPGGSFDELRANDAEYVLWLHRAEIIQSLLADAAVLAASFKLVESLTTDANYRDFFSFIAGDYYPKRADATFDSLVREKAKGAHTALVLGHARGGKFTPAHRETLARDNLGAGPGLDRAWAGAGAPLRLELAIELYKGLVVPASSGAAVLNEHVNRPLLEETLLKALALTRGTPQTTDQVLKMLEPLAAHLRQCKDGGAKLRDSKPLAELDKRVAEEVAVAIGGLPILSSAATATALDEPQRESIGRFIQRIRLGLTVRSLLDRDTPEWLTPARTALCDRVFGLKDAAPGKAIVWPEPTVRFRAAILAELDPPLCECLANHPAELEKFFAEVYLPLVRVRGFLAVSEAGTGGVFLRWGRRGAEGPQRFEKIFVALKTDAWLGEDAAIATLAVAHLDVTNQPADPWLVEPAKFRRALEPQRELARLEAHPGLAPACRRRGLAARRDHAHCGR